MSDPGEYRWDDDPRTIALRLALSKPVTDAEAHTAREIVRFYGDVLDPYAIHKAIESVLIARARALP